MEQKITLKEAMLKRKSVRNYDMTPLSNEEINAVLDYANHITSLLPDLKIKIRLIKPDNIKSISSWRSPHYLAIYSEKSDNDLINVGYIYEQFAVYLTSLGLGTCWATSISPKDTKEYEGLKWCATIAFGKASDNKVWRDNVDKIKRRSLSDIAEQADERLEIARIAPSAMNNQPWYFVSDDTKIKVYCVVQGFLKKWMSAMNKIDIGIAMAHLKMNNENFKFDIEDNPIHKKGYSYIGTITL